jgi:hypothetical protein
MTTHNVQYGEQLPGHVNEAIVLGNERLAITAAAEQKLNQVVIDTYGFVPAAFEKEIQVLASTNEQNKVTVEQPAAGADAAARFDAVVEDLKPWAEAREQEAANDLNADQARAAAAQAFATFDGDDVRSVLASHSQE